MRVIDPIFLNSPLVSNEVLNDILGCRLAAKVETLNPIRSFKGRGTSFFIRTALADDVDTLVTASAGNFGQGLAYAATAAGRKLTVYAATTANPDKVDAMRRLGATVVLEGGDFDAAKLAAVAFAAETDAYLVIDGNEPAIAEGAGTIGLEMLQQWTGGLLDSVIVSLGNGALATGVGAWVKHASPKTDVVAVGAKGAPSMALSWRERKVIETATADTIADGIAVRVPVPYALDTMDGTVDAVADVDDDNLIAAMHLVHKHFGLVVEPAGVAGIAAILAEPARWAGRSVGTVLCGANIDRTRAPGWLHEQHDLTHAD
ncbi:threonine ammonia-lyase [Nocardia sp. NPDC004711]